MTQALTLAVIILGTVSGSVLLQTYTERWSEGRTESLKGRGGVVVSATGVVVALVAAGLLTATGDWDIGGGSPAPVLVEREPLNVVWGTLLGLALVGGYWLLFKRRK